MIYEVDVNKVIETDRLILRYINKDDKEAYFNNICHDHDVLKYFVTDYKESIDEINIEKFINKSIELNRYVFSIVLKETNEVMGIICQYETPTVINNKTEIAYALGKKYWGHGYMSEALPAMVEFLKSLNIHKIAISHFKENIPSKRVIEKSNFVYEGVRVSELYYHERYWDLVYYYIINE